MPTFRARSDIAPLRPLHRQGSMSRLLDPLPVSPSSAGGCGTKPNCCLASSSSRNLRRFTSSFDLGPAPTDFEANATVMNSRPKGVRPLPPIPTSPPPYSALSPRDPPSPRVIRPLPSPPASPSQPAVVNVSTSPTQHQSAVVTPSVSATSALNITPAPNATPALSVKPPPLPLDAPSSRPILPPLVTDMELLKPPVPAEPVSGSNSPATPQPPTPQTAKRKRMSKLRRHLGERIPDDAVPIIQVTAQRKKEQGLERLQKLGVDSIYLRAAITVGKILSIPDDGGSDRSSVASDDDEAYEWALEGNKECRAVGRRESRKWVREKGGQRWEESNYEKIIQALRAL